MLPRNPGDKQWTVYLWGESNTGKSIIIDMISELLVVYPLEDGVTEFSLEVADQEFVPHVIVMNEFSLSKRCSNEQQLCNTKK